ncbi:MAG: hypothetical protein WC869_15800 [Phycisphaerae bacterium]|jgi:hypothetical protein
MSGGPTIVVKFGESVSAADQDLFVLELDAELNVDTAGKAKSEFVPGDEIFFLMHYDAARLRVQAIKTTAGQVVLQGQVSRSKTDEQLFVAAASGQGVSEPVVLPHLPSAAPTVQWFGRESALTRTGRSLTAAVTPCLGKITYNYNATSAKLSPPPLNLAPGEEFPVAVVIYVEANL